jgi:hypothetical protein
MTKSVIRNSRIRNARRRTVAPKAGRAVAVAAWDESGNRLVLTLSQTPLVFPAGLWRLAQGTGEQAGTLIFEREA